MNELDRQYQSHLDAISGVKADDPQPIDPYADLVKDLKDERRMQIEKIIELNADYRTAVNFAIDLRNPKNGIHAQAVESRVNEDCWNVRMVINP